jgi:hypothetical protein
MACGAKLRIVLWLPFIAVWIPTSSTTTPSASIAREFSASVKTTKAPAVRKPPTP